MKVLCISDHPDPVVYSYNIKKRFKDIDLIISCGDLPFTYYDFIVSNLNKPLYFVFGNHNLKWYNYFHSGFFKESWGKTELVYSNPFGMNYLEGKIRIKKGIIMVGLGGSIRYSGGQNQYTDRKMFFRILKLLPKLLWNRLVRGRFLDILVTHAAPFGIHDQKDLCHRGFRSFIWFMNKFKPRYLIHGHIHLYDQCAGRMTRYRDTVVLNAYNHTVVEIV